MLSFANFGENAVSRALSFELFESTIQRLVFHVHFSHNNPSLHYQSRGNLWLLYHKTIFVSSSCDQKPKWPTNA